MPGESGRPGSRQVSSCSSSAAGGVCRCQYSTDPQCHASVVPSPVPRAVVHLPPGPCPVLSAPLQGEVPEYRSSSSGERDRGRCCQEQQNACALAPHYHPLTASPRELVQVTEAAMLGTQSAGDPHLPRGRAWSSMEHLSRGREEGGMGRPMNGPQATLRLSTPRCNLHNKIGAQELLLP